MPDTVLVTGGAGFVGSTLVDRLLAEGRRVVAVDDLSRGTLANLARARADYPGAFEFHRLDVTTDAVAAIVARHRPSVIFHLAGPGDARGSVDDPTADALVQVIGTIRVLEAARRHGVRKVTVTTSAATTGTAPAPLARVAGQRSALEYVRAYGEAHGVDWTILALTHVYGPRQDTSASGGPVGRMLAQQVAGEPCSIHGDGERTIDLIHVDDVVDALARTITRGDGCRLAIGSGQGVALLQLHAALAAATGTAHEPIHAPPREDDLALPVVEVAPARDALGWEPFTPLDRGLANTLRSLQAG